MVRADEWRRQQVLGWLEKTLQEEVIALAGQLGWKHYHTYNSKRSVAGFPDLVLVHGRQKRSLFRELKRTKEKPSPDQALWLGLLESAGHDVGVWRPADWISGRIESELKGRA